MNNSVLKQMRPDIRIDKKEYVRVHSLDNGGPYA